MSATQPSRAVKLGCIADDFTGATDLANNLVRSGMRVIQTIGVPEENIGEADAIVVALKSRTIPSREAVTQSLDALTWLKTQGASQFYFKICSTFDSTSDGNIGPVAEALMKALSTDFCCVTPAFPENHRTVFKGHLFVGDQLLSDSGMRNHPLTPMTNSNLVQVMQAQSDGKVALIEHATVKAGCAAIQDKIAHLRSQGFRFAIVDAIDNEDLLSLGRAISMMPLVVAGSGVAIGLPQNHGLTPSTKAAQLPPAAGLQAIVSGSCSIATNRQVAEFIRAGLPALAIDPLRIAAGHDVVQEALDWASKQLGTQPVLIYSSADPASVKDVQGQLGVNDAGAMVEHALAAIAKGLVDLGVRQLLVAGGETSGACVQALGVAQMRIGQQIDPGVPWCYAGASACSANIHIALKSGNFGTSDFFTKAYRLLS
jgi:3-dehydrotetronate 4-kinase